MKLDKFLETHYGYNSAVKAGWEKPVDLWRSWYKGKVKDFHKYRIYNGQRHVEMKRLSMQMAKKCCEDWADLLFNEKCSVSLTDENSLETLNEILSYNNFWQFMNESIEKAGADGTGAVIVSVKNMKLGTNTLDVSEANTSIEYVSIEHIYPITWKGRTVTECAFATAVTVRGENLLYVSIHKTGDTGNYVIENWTFKNNSGNLTPLENDGFVSSFDTGSAKPWFAFLSPQQSNNIDPELPWGLPFFANAIDTLYALDLAFDSLSFEINASRRRTFIRQEAASLNLKNGELVSTFDPNDISLYVLPEGLNKDDLVQTESSEIRSASICETIAKNLSIFSSQVGFGSDRYKFDAPSMATATQVISQNSEMYRRKKKHETGLESAIYDIVTAICYASTAFGPYNINTDGLTINFDQSVIEDKEAISNRALRELSAGVISKAEYRVKVFGEDPETAREIIDKIKEEEPDINTLLGLGN